MILKSIFAIIILTSLASILIVIITDYKIWTPEIRFLTLGFSIGSFSISGINLFKCVWFRDIEILSTVFSISLSLFMSALFYLHEIMSTIEIA
jgi:hypothetical protein